ncbi:MAG TPA: BadF/BadG/BcrA/BcrD ATPase family protein [Candidatus Limnocylindrales bacterium]
MTEVILAVDGGNSKTDVALCSADGRLLAAVRGPTTSHQAIGLEAGLERLAGLIGEARALAPDARDPDLAVCCLAGFDLPSDEARLQAAYVGRGFGREVHLFNDTFAALRAGTPDGWGVAVICGSGMNAVGRAPDGRLARFAALGEIAGDRGGGSGLGMWGLGAAVRAIDGRGPATTLSALVPAHFGLSEPEAVTEALYAGRIPGRRVGELAPVVAAAARDGDAVAVRLVDDVGDEIAAFATASIRRLGLEGEPVPVTLAGGLARGAADLLVPYVSSFVRAIAPRAEVSVLHAPPVLGAALLGLDHLAPGDRAASDRLRAEIGAWDADLRASEAAKTGG